MRNRQSGSDSHAPASWKEGELAFAARGLSSTGRKFAQIQVICPHRMLAILPNTPWFRYSAGGAQLGLDDGRWPDSAKFEQFEPKRFYLR